MELSEVEAAIEADCTKAEEIRQHVSFEQRGMSVGDGLDYSHVTRELKNLAEDGDLDRHKNGRGYEYEIATDDGDDDATEAAESVDAGDIDPHRDYEFEEWVPSNVPEYVATDGEFDEISCEIEYIEEANNPAHIRLTGPTGAGKTHLPTYIAQERGYPLFDISVKWAIDTTDLLGRFVYVNDETRWVNGPLTKALLASKEGPVVLLLDEINRARPEAKAALFEALDDRAQVTIDALGGETVEGNAENIILFSTMNVGSGHVVEELDLAEQRRLGGMWEVDYLGMNHPEREADLLTERTPVHQGLAENLVDAANDVRELAADVSEQVDRGVPTGLLIEWASSAHKYALGDLSNPVMRAAKSNVVRAFYQDGDRDAGGRDTVTTTFESHFDGCPTEAVLDTDEWEAWTGETLEDEIDAGNDPDAAL